MAAVPHTAGRLARQSSAPARFALLRSGLGFEPCGSGGVALIPGPSPDEAGEGVGVVGWWRTRGSWHGVAAWPSSPALLPTKREKGGASWGGGAIAGDAWRPALIPGPSPDEAGEGSWSRGVVANAGSWHGVAVPPSSPALLPTKREKGVESRGGGQRREAGTAWPAHPRLRSGLGFDWGEGSGVGVALRVPGTRTRTAC